MSEGPDVGHLEGRTILVTGGAGFLGRHLVEAILEHTREAKCVVLSRDEAKHARMAETLRRHADRLRFRLGDVRDPERLRIALWKTDIVVHAASLKRVDDTARHPYELVKTNISGTQHVLEACLEAGVGKIVVITTDKGVLASTAYGATKCLAECLSVAWNAVAFSRNQLVACARLGNVMGSTGSVLHTFRRSVKARCPILIMDPRMTRFWMGAAQAVQFICRVLLIMRGGEIFVPKLPAAPVTMLARSLHKHPHFKNVGRRPGGEKLHEVLISEHEAHRGHDLGDMFVIEPEWDLPVQREPWGGELLRDGFRYASDTTPKQLKLAALRAMADSVDYE